MAQEAVQRAVKLAEAEKLASQAVDALFEGGSGEGPDNASTASGSKRPRLLSKQTTTTFEQEEEELREKVRQAEEAKRRQKLERQEKLQAARARTAELKRQLEGFSAAIPPPTKAKTALPAVAKLSLPPAVPTAAKTPSAAPTAAVQPPPPKLQSKKAVECFDLDLDSPSELAPSKVPSPAVASKQLPAPPAKAAPPDPAQPSAPTPSKATPEPGSAENPKAGPGKKKTVTWDEACVPCH